MRRLFFTLALLLVPFVSQAATTFNSANCNSSITISNGGLTLTANATNSYKSCFANVPKYSGKWYFTGTFGTTPDVQAIGIAANGTGTAIGGAQSINGGFAVNNAFPAGADIYAATFNNGNATSTGYMAWVNQYVSSSKSIANGDTILIAVNFDSDPIQIWGTDLAWGLLCNGSGSSGSSNPLWNAGVGTTCANDPSIVGTGSVAPATYNGGIGVPGYAWLPVWSGYNSDAVTFDFADQTTIDGYLPVGYAAWNGAGGGAPTPGPNSPMVRYVNNAPTYSNGATMTAGNSGTSTPASRILGGPGCTKSGFTRGSNCWVWQAQDGGTLGTGDTSSWTCATPAGPGNIYATSLPGASTETDNGVTFACLYKIDYNTITGSVVDDSKAWTTGTGYLYKDIVINAGGAYMACSTTTGSTCPTVTWNGSAPFKVTAGASAPTCTTIGSACYDGAINWIYLGAVNYSSAANIWPHEIYPGGSGAEPESQTNYSVQTYIGYGGHDQQTYLTGSNGEGSPIMEWMHGDYIFDEAVNCYKLNILNGALNYLGTAGPNQISCLGKNGWQPHLFTAVAGESVFDNTSASVGPLGYVDPTKGVVLENTAAYTSASSPYITQGEPVAWSDQNLQITRLVLYSPNGKAVSSHDGGPGAQRLNGALFKNDVIWTGATTAPAAVSVDGADSFQDVVVVDKSTVSGQGCLQLGYPGPIINVTCIGNSATNGTVLQFQASGAGMFASGGVYAGPPFQNIVGLGFTYCWAYGGSAWSATSGGNDATDQSSCPTSTYTGSDGFSYTGAAWPGSGNVTSITSSAFVNSSLSSGNLDVRIANTGSSLYGTGNTFSFSTGGSTLGTLTTAASDILGTAVPTSGRYDSGAVQFVPDAASSVPMGGLAANAMVGEKHRVATR